MLNIRWNNQDTPSSFDVEVQIVCFDRVGLFGDISRVFEDEKSSVLSLNARKAKDHNAIMDVTFEVNTKEQMRKIIRKLKAVRDVHDVFRVSG